MTKYRVAEWLDIRGPKVVFGVECKVGLRWRPCMMDGKPLVYKTYSKAYVVALKLEKDQ